MYVSFINPFKAELKLSVFEISWYKRENECGSISRGLTIVIFNLFISHSWVRFPKTSDSVVHSFATVVQNAEEQIEKRHD